MVKPIAMYSKTLKGPVSAIPTKPMSKPDKTLDRYWDVPQRELLELLKATPAGLRP